MDVCIYGQLLSIDLHVSQILSSHYFKYRLVYASPPPKFVENSAIP